MTFGYSKSFKHTEREEDTISAPYTKDDLAKIALLPIQAYPLRKNSLEAMEFFGVRTAVDERTGKPAEQCYPYFKEGKLTGFKIRKLPKEGFRVAGKIDELFGQGLTYEGNLLLVCEGEADCIAAYDMMRHLRPDRKPYNVVSLPSGTSEDGTLHPVVKRSIEWLSRWPKVVLLLDNDKNGIATANTLADFLCSATNVHIASLPLKDSAEMWEAGRAKEWGEAVNKAKAYRPEAIIEGQTLHWEDFRKNKEAGIELPYPKLQKKTWGLRKGEISLVVAGPGLGKSTFVQQICKQVSDKGYKVANIALETPFEDLVNYYVAMDRGIPKHKLVFNQSILSDEDYKESFERVAKRMHFFKWWGKIDSDVLVKKMHYFAKALEVDFIMLDHISIAVAGNDDERLEIDRLFESLTQLVVETGVGVLAVMHLKKSPGKNYNSGSPVELEDIRGSAGAAQMCWNIWSVERDQQGDNPNLCKIRVLKNRSIGPTGEADMLLYDEQTGFMNVYEVDSP